jgi:hypothetical protein
MARVVADVHRAAAHDYSAVCRKRERGYALREAVYIETMASGSDALAEERGPDLLVVNDCEDVHGYRRVPIHIA